MVEGRKAAAGSIAGCTSLCCRDIKPENIFLTGRTKFKMGDLGLAIRATEELPFTRSGTLDYMAPEVGCWHRALADWAGGVQGGLPMPSLRSLIGRSITGHLARAEAGQLGLMAPELGL